jgi:creatinine amidohydrolase/Fe(II)-dependent formamide hydrolase-like protein
MKKKKEKKKKKQETVLLGELTREAARKRFEKCDIAILPVGSLEQHGPHLPLDTDAYDAYWFAQQVAIRVKTPKPLVCPPINYGISYHHGDFFDISISPTTLTNMVYEIGVSLAKYGVKKLVIINGHGGNIPALKCAAQLLNRDFNMFVCVDTGDCASKEIRKIIKTRDDVHSGEAETSTTLAIRSHLVDTEKIPINTNMRFPSQYLHYTGDNVISAALKIKDISESGVLGMPSKASAQKGKKIWAAAIKNFTSFIEDLKRWKR